MTRDDIANMWEKANGWSIEGWPKTIDEIERFAKLVAAAEHKAILETVDELTGAEQYRNAMFSDGYDYALGHVKQFIEGRAHEQR